MATLLDRLRQGLARTRQSFAQGLRGALARGRVDGDLYSELEALLIAADVGIAATEELLASVKGHLGETGAGDPRAVEDALKEAIREIFAAASRQSPSRAPAPGHGPEVVMLVGVNGAGKTTTLGKLARRETAAGRKVLIGACDTFRAAAGEQLETWAERAGVQIVRQRDGADPAAVAFDALAAAEARQADLVLLDTAGRLHTKTNLMEELKKVHRIVGQRIPGAPHEVLLCLDATTGQNAIRQARLFDAAIGVDGLVLAKLDGTARGGVVVAIARELRLPVRWVGIGEGVEDLVPFDPEMFVDALFSAPGAPSPAPAGRQ
jgi:fused signal recognition particle receptor